MLNASCRGSGEMIDQFWQLAGQAQARAQPNAIAAYQLMESYGD